jgi:histidyl-tRNA synthetase
MTEQSEMLKGDFDAMQKGTFREFLQNEFENLGTITPEAAETIIDNEEAEWA